MTTINARLLCALAGSILISATSAHAQLRVLLADRAAGRLWSLTDRNADGTIDPTELRVVYDGSNLAGSPGLANPNTIGVTADSGIWVGDQDPAARHWLALRDRDWNGDTLGASESLVAANASNAGGFSFAFPTGFAQSPAGPVYLVNAGNTSGPDQVFIGTDSNADGDVQDPAEVIGWVSVNGYGTNGSHSPQEIVFAADGNLYLHNSSANFHGLFRLRDDDNSGRIDQPSEFALFWGLGNAPGILPSAGFAVDVDPSRPRSFYYHQLATGGVDQILRLTDTNNDGDAQDDLESAIVYSTAETGFTSVDLLAIPDGRVLFSDNSGIRVISLRDLDGDGLFTSAGERTDFLPAGLGVLAARAMAIWYCPADFNHDLTANPDDLGDFINCYFSLPSCDRADFNADGTTDPDDLGDFINVYFGPGC